MTNVPTTNTTYDNSIKLDLLRVAVELVVWRLWQQQIMGGKRKTKADSVGQIRLNSFSLLLDTLSELAMYGAFHIYAT